MKNIKKIINYIFKIVFETTLKFTIYYKLISFFRILTSRFTSRFLTSRFTSNFLLLGLISDSLLLGLLFLLEYPITIELLVEDDENQQGIYDEKNV